VFEISKRGSSVSSWIHGFVLRKRPVLVSVFGGITKLLVEITLFCKAGREYYLRNGERVKKVRL
jgi:hypothetical protein